MTVSGFELSEQLTWTDQSRKTPKYRSPLILRMRKLRPRQRGGPPEVPEPAGLIAEPTAHLLGLFPGAP